MSRLEFRPHDPTSTAAVGRCGFWLAVSCPTCGGRLVSVATGTGGLDTRAVVFCDPCRRHWVIAVTLAEVTDELGRPGVVEGHPHGTASSYARGCRCPECRGAAAARQRDHRRRQGAVA